jgi:phosphatidylglycerol lysyltransferase
MAGHHYKDQQQMGPELCGRLEALAREHGIYSDSYVVMDNREYFWLPDHSGVIGFVRLGRHFKVIGGVIAPARSRASLLHEFIAFVRAHRGTLAFFNIGQADLALFEAEHFAITKLGEEAVLDLTNREWRGRQFDRLRQQVNFCRRKGVVIIEVPSGPPPDGATAALHAEIMEIERKNLAEKPQSEVTKVIQAQLHPGRLCSQRIFVARSDHGRGRIEGFVVIFPGKSGAMWSTEIYRHRPDGVRNVVVFLIHEVANLLKAEGRRELTLGLVAALRCHQPRPGDNPLVRWGLQMSWNWLGFVFDLKGVYAFKNRFRPRYEDRFCCTWPSRVFSLGSSIAFLRLWGVTKLDPLRTIKTFFRHALIVRRERITLESGREP